MLTKEKDKVMQSVRLSVDWELINQNSKVEHEFYSNPNEDIDVDNNQCICGEYNCKESYVHWTSGF